MKTKKLSSIKKFYFLDYFSVLLESIAISKTTADAFFHFKELKEKKQLGESKYKKIAPPAEELSDSQFVHYKYTFFQVIEESKRYDLIKEYSNYYSITELGNSLLTTYRKKGQEEFNYRVFDLMETKIGAFSYLVKACYTFNPTKDGLLIFPIYSPLKLGMPKSGITKGKDVIAYTVELYKKLEEDIHYFLKKKIKLEPINQELLKRLLTSKLVGEGDAKFDSKNYNKVVQRVRDFWLHYFLREIYEINLSPSFFEIWVYRAKQLGIFNASEFYPGIDGKIVYPISLLLRDNVSGDFKKIFTHPTNESLYIHDPKWGKNQGAFVSYLYDSYHDLKSKNKSHFINLGDLRDIVCFKMKISDQKFNEFLRKAYLLNLKDELKIKIALESDKLPEETKAIYLKREPVLISGKPRNIIAIELKSK